MTQNENELLLKDLSARLSYGVKVKIKYYDDVWKLLAIYTNGTTYVTRDINHLIETYFEDCKPYLIPLSSMTDEQYEEFINISGWDGDIEDIRRGKFLCLGTIGIDYIYDTIDWFNKNHFDYRGLIKMGLAIDATDLKIY